MGAKDPSTIRMSIVYDFADLSIGAGSTDGVIQDDRDVVNRGDFFNFVDREPEEPR